MGAKSKYETYVKPYLSDIKKAVEAGATVLEVSQALDISESSLYKYIQEKPELKKAFARGRKKIVFDIRAALLKKAKGYEYEEEKRTGKKDKNGEQIILVEQYKRHCPPSETAAAMLLRNYTTDWLDHDNISTELKRQELSLKKAIAESNYFDIDLKDV